MIVTKTPLRMSFAGGGSDLREYYKHGYGAVVSTALDKYVYITANGKFTDNIRVGYSVTEYVDNVDDIEHHLVRESLKLTGIKSGIDVVYMSDMLPDREGSGLGGSSSILVGTLHALHAFKEELVSPKTLAEEACNIEIETLGHPIGKQDQYAAAYGGFNYIQFNADETVSIEPISFKKETQEKLRSNLLMFHTGFSTRSDKVLTEQRRETKNNLEILDSMVVQAKKIRNALHNNDLTEFGKLLHHGWLKKQKLASNITNSSISKYYEKARKAGAVGGKILGSGGGGFLLLYCEEENQANVRNALLDLKETPVGFDSLGSRIIYMSD